MKRLLPKSRLTRKAIMNPEVFQNTIDQLGDQGRKILQEIEEYKFKMEQAARIVANNPMLAQKIVQKRKSLDQAAGEIYAIVFDIENMDIVEMYDQQQMMINNPGMMGGPNMGMGDGMPVENMPMNGQPQQPGEQNGEGDFGGGGFGGAPMAAPEGGEAPEGEEGEEGAGDEGNEGEENEEAPEGVENEEEEKTPPNE
jgi:hypothetical protein